MTEQGQALPIDDETGALYVDIDRRTAAPRAQLDADMMRHGQELQGQIDGELLQMLNESKAAIAAMGLAISPEAHWLATAPLRAHRLLADSMSTARLYGITPDPAVMELYRAYNASMEQQLRWPVRKALATGAIASVVVGAGVPLYFGHLYYKGQTTAGTIPPVVHGQILPNNSLTVDGSVPIFGLELPNVTYGDVQQTTELVPKTVVAQASTLPEVVRNPVALDLKLTGKEYAIDLETARKVLGKIIDEKGEIIQVAIVGTASDELDGKLGEKDSKQEALSAARAEVARKALVKVAGQLDVELPKKMSVTSKESVLSEDDIKKVEQMAQGADMTTAELLTRYNAGEQLPDDIKHTLDTLLTRGATYTIDYETNTTTGYELVGPQFNRGDPLRDAAVFGGLAAILAAFYSTIMRAKLAPRSVRRAARRKLDAVLKDAARHAD